jgi:hypothetical protein
MEFLSFDTAMQIASDRRARLLEQAGNERRPRGSAAATSATSATTRRPLRRRLRR